MRLEETTAGQVGPTGPQRDYSSAASLLSIRAFCSMSRRRRAIIDPRPAAATVQIQSIDQLTISAAASAAA